MNVNPHVEKDAPAEKALQARFEANLSVLAADPARCEQMGITVGQLRLLGKRWRREHDGDGLSGDKPAIDDVTLPHEHDSGSLCPRPYVIRGVCPPDLLIRVHGQTVDVFNKYSPKLYVLEPAVDQLIGALHTHDLTSVLADERVVILVGGNLVRRLESVLDDETDATSLPKYHLALASAQSGNAEQLNAMITALDDKRTQRTVQLHRQAEAAYVGRDRAYWSARYKKALSGSGPPLRVLIPVSRYSTYVQHAAMQLARALARIGCETRMLTEADSHCVMPASAYARAFAEWQPDLVCQIDHLRHESRGLIPARVPHWCWVQDRLAHLFNPIAGTKVDPLEMVLGLGIELLVTQHGYPVKQCLPVLNGSDVEVYAPEPLPQDELHEHRCDVSYVSNHSEPADRLARSLINNIANDDQERRFLKWLHRLLCEIVDDDTHEPTTRIGRNRLIKIMQAKSAGRFTNDGLNQVYDFFCLPLVDRMYRHQALRWVIHYCQRHGRTLKLYGRGWEQHEMTRPFARGEVANGRSLRAVYQASQVNLHVSSFGSLHQRVFDGYAAGGLVLCRRSVSDASYGLYRLAVRASEKLGTGRFRLDQAPELEREWTLVQTAGRCNHNSKRMIDLRQETWKRFAQPESPCHFRSLGQLAAEVNTFSFWSERTLGERLDRFLDHPEAREPIVRSVRQAIVDSLSLDTIARYALMRYCGLLDGRPVTDGTDVCGTLFRSE